MKKQTEAQQRSHSSRDANLHLVAWVLMNFAMTVSAAPPRIDYPPRSQSVILYQQAAFGVIASGTAPLAYQWRKDGVPVTGATHDQIVITQAQFSDAGRYSVVVANAEGSVTSVEAGLTVNPPKAGDLDFSFVWGGSINGWVESVVVQPDGKILIGGEFTTVHGAARSHIARLNADGSTDYTFMNGLSGADDWGTVYSIAVQGDGKILIGGSFNTVNGVSRNLVARLNADGSLDLAFQDGLAKINGVIRSIALQRDGRVLIGGEFIVINGQNRNEIARLNTDGTLDGSFPSGAGGANYVEHVTVQSDGKVIIAGGFTIVNGVGRTGIARLNADGTLDSGFHKVSLSNAPSVDPAYIEDVEVQPDGKVLIGGRFTAINGVRRTGIARLNADGTLDAGFQTEVSGDFILVLSLAVQSDGKILLTGHFTTVNGVPAVGIARLNADGTLDRSFQNVGLVESYVIPVAVQSDGKVLIGGTFLSVNGKVRNHIARLNADGTLDSNFQNGLSGVNGGVHSVAVQSDDKVLIGGGFDRVNGESHNNIARLNPDGTLDTSFQNGLSGANDWIFSVVPQKDAKVLIGGRFTSVNGVTRNSIARLNLDGTLDSNFQNGLSGVNGAVRSVAVQSDGKVLIGGEFSLVNGVGHTNIARLNVDGTLDRGFQSAVSFGIPSFPNYFPWVYSVAVQSDGKVLIGGEFSLVNGVPAAGIARLWGSADIPPRIQSIRRTGADVNLVLDALPNRTYRVQYKANVSANTWTDLAGDVSGNPIGTASKTDTTLGSASQRFYRVVLLP